jgi:signal transduction histidine kinase
MKRRIMVCLGIILGLCLLGNVISMLCLHRSIATLTALAESRRIQSMRTNLVSDAVRIETDLLAYRAGHKHHAQQRDDHLRRFTESINQCSTCHHGPAIQARLDGLAETLTAYQAEAVELYSRSHQPSRIALEQGVQDLVDSLVRQATELSDQASKHLAVKSSDAIASVRQAWIVLIATLAAALCVGGIVAFHLMSRLTKPVEAMLQGIERVQRGDLGHRFTVDADEEFRTLANAFEHAYTNLKNAQHGMIQSEKMVSLGKLAAGVAHEVGNPLASISSIAQLMQRQSTSEEQARQLGLIMEQIGRISRIVRGLLSFSRPEGKVETGLVDIPAILAQAVTLIGYDHRARKIQISQQCEIHLPPVRGDADKLLLVFTNILMNSVDAICSQGDDVGGTILIQVAQSADDLLLRFEDDGPGMSEAQIADAFEPFFTTKSPGQGTGLGLWICYQTVQRHDGSISIASRRDGEDRSTTVTLRLPCAPAQGAAAADASGSTVLDQE